MIRKMIHIMMFKLVERKLIVRLLRMNKVKRKSRKSFRMKQSFVGLAFYSFSDLLNVLFFLLNVIFSRSKIAVYSMELELLAGLRREGGKCYAQQEAHPNSLMINPNQRLEVSPSEAVTEPPN
jgi:hypothetical protein